jgi:hypothetical protein
MLGYAGEVLLGVMVVGAVAPIFSRAASTQTVILALLVLVYLGGSADSTQALGIRTNQAAVNRLWLGLRSLLGDDVRTEETTAVGELEAKVSGRRGRQ